jgi:hypothetical protein
MKGGASAARLEFIEDRTGGAAGCLDADLAMKCPSPAARGAVARIHGLGAGPAHGSRSTSYSPFKFSMMSPAVPTTHSAYQIGATAPPKRLIGSSALLMATYAAPLEASKAHPVMTEP